MTCVSSYILSDDTRPKPEFRAEKRVFKTKLEYINALETVEVVITEEEVMGIAAGNGA